MSSPIHHPKDLDTALMYAPPWARERGSQKPFRPSAALARGQQRRKPVALSAYQYSGDRDMARLQRHLTLNPDRVPEPPAEAVRSLLPMVFRLCAVAGVAAAVAWSMISFPGVHLVRSEAAHVAASAPRPAAFPQKSEAVDVAASVPGPVTVPQKSNDPLRTETGVGLLIQHGLALATPPQSSVESEPVQYRPAVAAPPQPPAESLPGLVQPPLAPHPVETVPATVPPAGGAQPSDSHSSAVVKVAAIDSEEIATLVKRGKEALINGDLAAARLLLHRAAEGGSADAAFALGTTFDPVVLRRIHAIGVEADAARAREWYDRAAALGSTAKPPQN